tara:strand:- start:443 stop:967 length:525 start_codon:yes stop_codon:yes gene_type:complete
MYIFYFVFNLWLLYYCKVIYDTLIINTVYIVRGISGSGKSHYVQDQINDISIYNNNTYLELNIYDILKEDETITSKKIAKTYNDCLNFYINSLMLGYNHIYVTNPFISKWEYDNYILLARQYRYRVVIIEMNCNSIETLKKCFNRSLNVKNYNLIKNQYDNFEHDKESQVINIE